MRLEPDDDFPASSRAPRESAAASVPVGRLLKPVRDVQDPRFREIVALYLQADRQAVPSKPQGIDIAGAPVRLAATVKMSFRYICTGSSAFAPIRNAADGAVGPMITSHFSIRAAEIVGDQRRTCCAFR